MSDKADPTASIHSDFLEKVTPDAWKNIPKCIIDTIKAIIENLFKHDKQHADFAEFQAKQLTANASFEKRFSLLESSLNSGVEQLNKTFAQSIQENLAFTRSLHNKSEDVLSSIALKLREKGEEMEKGFQENESQRATLMKKIGELEIKLFIQKQELEKQFQSSIVETKQELTTCPGLYGINEKLKTLGDYLICLRKELEDSIHEHTQEAKLEVTIESSKLNQKMDKLDACIRGSTGENKLIMEPIIEPAKPVQEQKKEVPQVIEEKKIEAAPIKEQNTTIIEEKKQEPTQIKEQKNENTAIIEEKKQETVVIKKPIVSQDPIIQKEIKKIEDKPIVQAKETDIQKYFYKELKN